jgi:hypothetical protein
MTDERDNLILQHLRLIRADLGEMKTDLIEIKERLGLVEA